MWWQYRQGRTWGREEYTALQDARSMAMAAEQRALQAESRADVAESELREVHVRSTAQLHRLQAEIASLQTATHKTVRFLMQLVICLASVPSSRVPWSSASHAWLGLLASGIRHKYSAPFMFALEMRKNLKVRHPSSRK